jgi:hypothetical protein
MRQILALPRIGQSLLFKTYLHDSLKSAVFKVAGASPSRDRSAITVQAVALSLTRPVTSKNGDCGTD